MSGFTAKEFEPPEGATAKTGNSAPPPGAGGSAPGTSTGGSGGGNGASPGSSAGGTAGGPGAPIDWPEMGAAAYHGLVGDVVRTLLPQTEADPVAVLMQYIVYFGNAVGRGPYYRVESSKHYANLFALLVGATSKARKGLSADRIRSLYRMADEAWEGSCIRGGLSSGEGVLHAVRDPVFALRKGELTQIDPGIDDKRLLLDEREFYAALEVMKREGNIVSRVVRDAWDCRPVLETLTKNTHTRSTGGFISIAGHITLDEYRAKLDHTSMANGYANRFLNACVRRSKMLPFGGDPVDEAELANRTGAALNSARGFERVAMTDAAMELWVDVYPQLSRDVHGLLGALTARAEAQTVRIALVYALIDGKDQIDRVHLEAGLAVWAYCEASTRFIFGDVTGDTVADEILLELIAAGVTGRTRTELHGLCSRNRSGGDIGRALALLVKQNRARCVITPKPASGRGGRATETWFTI